jgi:hypothetical protein
VKRSRVILSEGLWSPTMCSLFRQTSVKRYIQWHKYGKKHFWMSFWLWFTSKWWIGIIRLESFLIFWVKSSMF